MGTDLGGHRPDSEHGSTFPWVHLTEAARPTAPSWGEHILFGSGRQALVATLAHGRERRGWRRVWIPAYYCPETTAAVRSAFSDRLRVRLYDGGPISSGRQTLDGDLAAGDVVVVVNYFGLGTADEYSELPTGTDYIEDHTHDPWSSWALGSVAAYCFASIRKTLPVPDGGVVWSGTDQDLPPDPEANPRHDAAAAMRLEAMLMKAMYLGGIPVPKSAYRELEMRSEQLLAENATAAASPVTTAVLPFLPVQEWRTHRLSNYNQAAAQLDTITALELLRPQTPDSVPYSIVLRFREASERDRVRKRLIARGIYPAILWELDEGVGRSHPAQEKVSGEILSLSCDFRYAEADMHRLTSALRDALDS